MTLAPTNNVFVRGTGQKTGDRMPRHRLHGLFASCNLLVRCLPLRNTRSARQGSCMRETWPREGLGSAEVEVSLSSLEHVWPPSDCDADIFSDSRSRRRMHRQRCARLGAQSQVFGAVSCATAPFCFVQ